MQSLKQMWEESQRMKDQDKERVRSISGMTSLLLPTIQADFPTFNEQELYARTEEILRKVFSALENLETSNLDACFLLKNRIDKIVEDYQQASIQVTYDDVSFHKFSLYSYEKKEGIATVVVSTSLEYYYQKKKNDKIIEGDTKSKRQTRYRCTFIYIYDESKVGDAKVLAINCPNCGAPVSVLGHKYCDYCGSAVQEVNLKSWECSSYQEY